MCLQAPLSGGNRLSSLRLANVCRRASIHAHILTVIARGRQSLQLIVPMSETLLLLLPPYLFVSCSSLQNQAEAHYKGHKHARKLKAIEAQKNRQRRAGEASSTGRERDRDRDRERDRSRAVPSEAAPPAIVDTSLAEGTTTST